MRAPSLHFKTKYHKTVLFCFCFSCWNLLGHGQVLPHQLLSVILGILLPDQPLRVLLRRRHPRLDIRPHRPHLRHHGEDLSGGLRHSLLHKVRILG
jgi:hypothetical protein